MTAPRVRRSDAWQAVDQTAPRQVPLNLRLKVMNRNEYIRRQQSERGRKALDVLPIHYP